MVKSVIIMVGGRKGGMGIPVRRAETATRNKAKLMDIEMYIGKRMGEKRLAEFRSKFKQDPDAAIRLFKSWFG